LVKHAADIVMLRSRRFANQYLSFITYITITTLHYSLVKSSISHVGLDLPLHDYFHGSLHFDVSLLLYSYFHSLHILQEAKLINQINESKSVEIAYAS